jgi:hypothetical protein
MFAELLRDRLAIPIPEPWKRKLPQAYYEGTVQDGQPRQPAGVTVDARDLYETKLQIWVPRGSVLTKDKGRIMFSVKNNSISLSEKVLGELVKEYLLVANCINAHYDKDRSIVAVYDPAGQRYPLLCVTPASGEVVWQSQVWAMGRENIPGGVGGVRHEQFLVITDKRIATFGTAAGGSYVEVFDRQTGAVQARFSTTYWSSRLE